MQSVELGDYFIRHIVTFVKQDIHFLPQSHLFRRLWVKMDVFSWDIMAGRTYGPFNRGDVPGNSQPCCYHTSLIP